MSIRPGRVALLVALFVVAVGVAAWSGQSWTPASEPMADEPRQVIVFGMAPLGFRDLGQGDTPVLDRLLEEGAVGAMSTRTGTRVSTPDEGYLAVGAGSRVRVAAGAGVAYEAAEQLPNGGTGATLFQEATGHPLDGGIGAAGAVASVRRNDGSALRSHPGALGQALREAGRSSAVVSNSDTVDAATGATIVDRPGVLALMDEDLAVDDGIVAGGRLLVEDPAVPFGRKADADAVVDAVERMAETHDVVLVDPGELARAAAYERHVTEEQEGRVRADALRRTDDILGRVLPLADGDTVLLVVSVAAGGDGLRLAPVVAVGGGLEPGYLVSPSVKRSGLLAITDLAPTILDLAGVVVPEELTGNAVRAKPDEVDVGRLTDLDRDTAFRERTYYSWSLGFIQLHGLVYGLAALVVCAGLHPRGVRSGLRLAALGLAAFPLATFVFRMLPDGAGLGDGAIWLVLLLDAVIALGASRLRRTPLSPMLAILGATLAVILVDASSGTALHVNSWLGYSLHGGGRFYGIPNTTYAVLAAAGLLVAATLVHYGRHRQEAVLAGGLLLALVAVIDGAPSLGGDVGGIVSLVPVFAVVVLALSERRLRPRTLVLVGAATAVALAVAIGIDLLRPPDARTHLGRWAADVADDGPGTVWDTFSRKQRANFRILRASIWAWMLPITIGFLGAVLWTRRRRDAILPPRSPITIGVIGTVAGSVVGFLANDSGPIVLGLFASVLLPVVLLLALDEPRPDDEPPPDPAPDPAVGREPGHEGALVEPEPVLSSR